jgi:GNAT superfamily N-acetyltransferase
LHYSNFLVACENEKNTPVAAALSYNRNDYVWSDWEYLERAIALSNGWSEDEVSHIQNRWMQVESCMPRYNCKKALIIECVATVNEAFRKQGIQRRLIQTLLQAGIERGFEKAMLCCLTGNLAAISFYRGMGFNIY